MSSHSISKNLDDLLDILEPEAFTIDANKIRGNNFRLDAGAYSGNVFLSQEFMQNDSTNLVKLSDIANIFGFGPFKRIYIEDRGFGIPLLSSSEMLQFEPNPNILSKSECPKWSQYLVKTGWIVVSCSGTIGNMRIIPKKWEGWGLSQHAIRVVPKKGYTGFIYSFLRLPWVKNQINAMKSGSVIDEIYPHDLNSLDVPVPGKYTIDKLESMVQDLLALREESDRQLYQARFSIEKVNGLKGLHRDESAWVDPKREIEFSIVTAREVVRNNDSGSEYRLDARFYNPLAKLAIKNINQCKSKVKTIEDVTERVFLVPRFKRNYVEKEYGVPFLSGKNIVQIRPADLKYLSKTETKNLKLYYLEKNWTLITCSGTIGRSCFVWENYENYTATQHILRVVPDSKKIDPGYLYAFLSSRYGYVQILRYRHGSVIDEITDKQVRKVLIPMPSENDQKQIGDLVRSAYEKRAEAIRLEDEAQNILMDALSK